MRSVCEEGHRACPAKRAWAWTRLRPPIWRCPHAAEACISLLLLSATPVQAVTSTVAVGKADVADLEAD